MFYLREKILKESERSVDEEIRALAREPSLFVEI
jgi:hypothetical protein